jgi:hypothetical protein
MRSKNRWTATSLILLTDKQLFLLTTDNNNLGKRTIDGEAWMKNQGVELFCGICSYSFENTTFWKKQNWRSRFRIGSESWHSNRFKFSSTYKLEDISAESVTIGTNEPVTGKSGTTLTKTTGWYIDPVQPDGLSPNADKVSWN